MAAQPCPPTTIDLDTSGHVRRPGFAKPLGWSDLDPFEQGYIEALAAQMTAAIEAEAREQANRLDLPRVIFRPVRFSDLAPETLARIIADCARHLASDWALQRLYAKHEDGARFWRLRNVGRWTDKDQPPLAPYLGDHGKVYLREPGQ